MNDELHARLRHQSLGRPLTGEETALAQALEKVFRTGEQDFEAVARALQRSPWRAAVIASSSWSHSFLVQKHSLMFPDVESDKRYYEALRHGDWDLWKNTSIEEVEDRGHHELLNWFCLAGAMYELGHRKPDESVFLESWISNSDKVFAVFRPNHAEES